MGLMSKRLLCDGEREQGGRELERVCTYQLSDLSAFHVADVGHGSGHSVHDIVELSVTAA